MGKGLFDRLQGEVEAREQSLGLQMSDLLALPEPECGLLNWMIRQGQVSLSDIAAWLAKDETETRQVLDNLIKKGYIREIEIHDITAFRVRLALKRGKTLPTNLWKALEIKSEQEEEKGQ